MKLFKNRQLLLRITAVVAEAVLFYIGFLPVNKVVGGNQISIILFIITGLCGLFVNLLPYNNLDKDKSNVVFGSIGLFLAAASIAVSSFGGIKLFAIPVAFAALIFLYYRAYTSYSLSIVYVYSAGSFNQSLMLLFVVNLAVLLFKKSFGFISEEAMRYTVLYIMMAIYMLTEVKRFKYVNKSENSRRTVFEIAATSGIIIITVIMSVPRVLRAVTFPFVWLFKIIYGWIAELLLLITYPIAWVMNFLFNLIPPPPDLDKTKPNYSNLLDMSDKYKENLKDLNSPLVTFIGKALAFMLMLAICAFAAYLLFRLIGKITRTEDEEDFIEDKEFLLRGSKDKKPGFINKLADSIKKTAGDIAFMLTADNRSKLRHEYKGFVKRLHSLKIIEDYNYTAQDILQQLLSRLPEQEGLLSDITLVYEEVRYGTKYPEDGELRSFRKNIAQISKNLQ